MKLTYHNDTWPAFVEDDCDIVMADQWSGMYKRWAFELMHKRLLHCIGFNYNKIKF